MGCSSSWAAQHVLLSAGSSPSRATCSRVDSPQGPGRKPAPAWAALCRSAAPCHGVTAPLGTHLLQGGAVHGMQVDLCSHMELHWLQGHSCLTISASLLLLLLYWPWCLHSHSSHTSRPSSEHNYISTVTSFPFFNMLSQRCYHHRWLAQPWPAVGPVWNQLALPLLDKGKASGSCSQKPALQPPPLPKPGHGNPKTYNSNLVSGRS